MLFNLQKLFQTEDNEARRAGYKDLLGMKKKKERENRENKTEGCRLLQNYSVETKLLDPLQQLSNDQSFPLD